MNPENWQGIEQENPPVTPRREALKQLVVIAGAFMTIWPNDLIAALDDAPDGNADTERLVVSERPIEYREKINATMENIESVFNNQSLQTLSRRARPLHYNGGKFTESEIEITQQDQKETIVSYHIKRRLTETLPEARSSLQQLSLSKEDYVNDPDAQTAMLRRFAEKEEADGVDSVSLVQFMAHTAIATEPTYMRHINKPTGKGLKEVIDSRALALEHLQLHPTRFEHPTAYPAKSELSLKESRHAASLEMHAEALYTLLLLRPDLKSKYENWDLNKKTLPRYSQELIRDTQTTMEQLQDGGAQAQNPYQAVLSGETNIDETLQKKIATALQQEWEMENESGRQLDRTLWETNQSMQQLTALESLEAGSLDERIETGLATLSNNIHSPTYTERMGNFGPEGVRALEARKNLATELANEYQPAYVSPYLNRNSSFTPNTDQESNPTTIHDDDLKFMPTDLAMKPHQPIHEGMHAIEVNTGLLPAEKSLYENGFSKERYDQFPHVNHFYKEETLALELSARRRVLIADLGARNLWNYGDKYTPQLHAALVEMAKTGQLADDSCEFLLSMEDDAAIVAMNTLP